MPELTDTQIRAVAIECASRSVESGAPTGHFLSSARMFETYIRSGLSQVGPRFRQGFLFGGDKWIMRVDGEMTEEQARYLQDALSNLLTEDQT